ncbi:GNAT family N-acetyltransferase [Streptomyces tateyamensis]|uniref:GNAT family N-acetyltransferase n=1 Tax=Streptomyces tateyamensis TaxID=565073 RepID=A0A2V4PSS4_9ACTN|nr:GNAT family N-acetyltransferase [Streptomyces tateyamensis]PYC88135.1 GNAT family N-acetyltransferase [Streptomyces tateyamensis]
MHLLTPLRPDHADAVLAFELANRAYFAAAIPDRGDAYFAEFAERFAGLLAEQADGVCAFYLCLAPDGSVLGRFNLVDLVDGGAELGYRVAELATGRGLATSAVRELCRLAATRHGLRTLGAAATDDNLASRRVLAKAGFTPTGPTSRDGNPATWYTVDLVRS